MARIDTARLILQSGQHIQTADAVRRDPAVIKAGKQVRDDAIQLARSTGALARETGDSWRRHS